MNPSTEIDFGTPPENCVMLSQSDIEEIVADIQKAKQTAKEHGGTDMGVCALHLSGALSVILCRIDQRIGDAVWME